MTWPVLTGSAIVNGSVALSFTGVEPIGIRAGAALVVEGFSPVEVISVTEDGSKGCTLASPWPYANVSGKEGLLIPLDGMLFEKVKELVQHILDVNTNFNNLLLSITALATTSDIVQINGADGTIYDVQGWLLIPSKADLSYVNDQLDLKANTLDVIDQLDLKANTLDVNNQLAGKADRALVQESLPVKSKACTTGWITILETNSGRSNGSVFVCDSESSDHSFILLEWSRAYASGSISVLGQGGNNRRLTGARWIYDKTNQAFGNWKLQVYSTVASVYYTKLRLGGNPGWDYLVTYPDPVNTVNETGLDSPVGYYIHGSVESMLDSKGSIGTIGTVHANDMKVQGSSVYSPYNKPSLADLGAAASDHTHDFPVPDLSLYALKDDYLAKAGGTLTGDVDNTGISLLNSGMIAAKSTNLRQAGNYGIYDPNKIGHIWSIGIQYKVHAEGADFGNIYGFAYKHTNNVSGGTMGGGHQAVWCINGSPYAALGSDIWAKNNVIAYSDKRVKTDIKVIENALEKIKAVNGVTYLRTDTEKPEPRQAGVIAQELIKVLPEVVVGGPTKKDPNALYSVAYGNIVALLIEGIKELSDKVDKLVNK